MSLSPQGPIHILFAYPCGQPARVQRHSSTWSVDFSPTQVRNVVVEAWACEDDEDQVIVEHDLRPVIGIAAEIYETFTRDRPRCTNLPVVLAPTASLDALREESWELGNCGVRYLPCWLGRDYAITTEVARKLYGDEGTVKVVPAPWPPEQDEAMLAEVIADLEARARIAEVAYIERQKAATRTRA
jgi:hypothetical protein